MSNYNRGVTDEHVKTQTHNASGYQIRIAADMDRMEGGPSGEDELAIRMLTGAIEDVKSRNLDVAALAYGWLTGMPSPLTMAEVCSMLGLDRGRIFDFVSELPNLKALKHRLIQILSNEMNELITRRQGESICIGGDTWVTVVEIKGRTVSLEVDAPIHVPIFPAEDDKRDARSPDLRS